VKDKEKFGRVHLAMLLLTLAFLAAASWTAVQDRRVGAPETYAVRTERRDTAAEKSRIDVNTAAAEELEQLTGIGPALAEAIVRYRAEHGPFQSAEELLRVSGIGEGKLEAIRDEITLGQEANG